MAEYKSVVVDNGVVFEPVDDHAKVKQAEELLHDGKISREVYDELMRSYREKMAALIKSEQEAEREVARKREEEGAVKEAKRKEEASKNA